MLIAFNKPFGVMCKFRPELGRRTLADYIPVPNVYPAGRLDTSERLLLLTDDGALQARIATHVTSSRKSTGHSRGVPTDAALAALRKGVDLGDFVTKPAGARLIDEPAANLWLRDPPIRYRAKIPTAWIEVTLREGKNRQVRRMTARSGFPTLRLVRVGVGRVALWTALAPASGARSTPPRRGRTVARRRILAKPDIG